MRGSLAFTLTNKFFVESCCECGIEFAMPDAYKDERVRDKKSFYCPSGHPQSYRGETHEAEVKRLKAQAEQERQWKITERERADAQVRVNRALRGQATKLRKRISGGVCPCCNRTFVELGRHMKTKHPDFSGQEIG